MGDIASRRGLVKNVMPRGAAVVIDAVARSILAKA